MHGLTSIYGYICVLLKIDSIVICLLPPPYHEFFDVIDNDHSNEFF
jgi:hypothetical protein